MTRSHRYHSGNWVTSHTHTIGYINITGGHSFDRRGLHSEPFGPLSIMHSLSREHKRNPSMQQNQAERKRREKCAASRVNKTPSKKLRGEQKCGLGLRWRSHTKLWGRSKERCFILNCSYLHHNVKGVLVEQEHKKQTEKLFSVSQRRNRGRKRPGETSGGSGLQRLQCGIRKSRRSACGVSSPTRITRALNRSKTLIGGDHIQANTKVREAPPLEGLQTPNNKLAPGGC